MTDPERCDYETQEEWERACAQQHAAAAQAEADAEYERELALCSPSPAADTTEQTHPHQCPTCGEHWEHASDACEVIYPHKEWAKCPFCEGRDK